MASIKDLLSPMDGPEVEPDRHPYSTSTQEAAPPENPHFTIEFILDTICPHCYIGLRNLNTAIDLYKQRYPGATFAVTCSPIILNPTALRSVDIKQDYYLKTRGFASSTIAEWTSLGAEVGINFSWQGGFTGNSRDSHKLLRLALESNPSMRRSSSFTPTLPAHARSAAVPGGRGPQTQMHLLETIFREYFERDHDLSDRNWLRSVGASILAPEVSPAEIQACLESEEWHRAIDRLSDRNRDEFSAVPVFILQGRFIAGGWQRPELFLEIFERIRTGGTAGPPGGMFSQPGGGSWAPGGVFRGAGPSSGGPGAGPSAGGAYGGTN